MKKIRISPATLYIISCILMALLIVIVYRRLPPQIPLFYSLPAGNEQVADTWLIIILPLLALICILLNALVQVRLLARNDFTDKVTRISNFAIIIGCAYIFIKIIFRVVW